MSNIIEKFKRLPSAIYEGVKEGMKAAYKTTMRVLRGEDREAPPPPQADPFACSALVVASVPPAEDAQPGPEKKETSGKGKAEKGFRYCWAANVAFKVAVAAAEKMLAYFPTVLTFRPWAPFIIKFLIALALVQLLKRSGALELLHYWFEQVKEAVRHGVEIFKSEFWQLLLNLYWEFRHWWHELAFGY